MEDSKWQMLKNLSMIYEPIWIRHLLMDLDEPRVNQNQKLISVVSVRSVK